MDYIHFAKKLTLVTKKTTYCEEFNLITEANGQFAGKSVLPPDDHEKCIQR